MNLKQKAVYGIDFLLHDFVIDSTGRWEHGEVTYMKAKDPSNGEAYWVYCMEQVKPETYRYLETISELEYRMLRTKELNKKITEAIGKRCNAYKKR